MSAIEQVQFPDKLFYRIQEVAAIVGVKAYVLRFWETEIPMLSPEKDSNDQRRYRRSDIELILEIKRLLYQEKFTIAGACRKLRMGGRGGDGAAAANRKSAGGVASVSSPVAAAPVAGVVSDVPAVASVVDLRPARNVAPALADLRRDVTDLYKLLS